jgi:alkaline phosphatase
MRTTLKRISVLTLTTALLFLTGCVDAAAKSLTPASAAPAKNVILIIGDGMGFEQVKAAGMYASGAAGTLSFESLPYKGQVSTYSADEPVTDSAAAGTAMATGIKVDNGVISMKIPGDSSELKTMLEHYKEKGKAVGLVSTAFISHATPAAFGAHEPARGNYKQIINDYLTQTKPDVLMGGAKAITPSAASDAGYTVITDRKSLLGLDTDKVTQLSGQFGKNHMPYEYDGIGKLPHLSDMAMVAIDILDNDPDGFFLMIEAGRIDHAGHGNKLERNIFETIELSNTVAKTLKWAKGRKDTLIIVTADHETGGLKVTESDPAKNKFPKVEWKTDGHTGVNVPVYAWGVGAEEFAGVMDNTDFFLMITEPLVMTVTK